MLPEKKAYDLKDLAAKCKEKGLDVAEEGAKVLVQSVFEWVKESAALSKTPYDDMVMVVMPQLEKMALSEVDKIDGHEG